MTTIEHAEMRAVQGGINYSRWAIRAGAALIGAGVGGVAGAIVAAYLVEELLS